MHLECYGPVASAAGQFDCSFKSGWDFSKMRNLRHVTLLTYTTLPWGLGMGVIRTLKSRRSTMDWGQVGELDPRQTLSKLSRWNLVLVMMI